MNNFKLNILFLLRKNRHRKDGRVPLVCRLTYKNNRREFATWQFINATYWNRKKQFAEPPDDENNVVNRQLSLIKSKIYKAMTFEHFLTKDKI